MSDHISGPRALAEPIADITDFYAFPSPERAGRLVLVDEHAAVCAALGAVLGGLIYRFRLRPLSAGPRATLHRSPLATTSLSLTACSRARRNGTAPGVQEGTCTTGGETVSFQGVRRAGGSATAFAYSPARAGIRLSWTPRRL